MTVSLRAYSPVYKDQVFPELVPNRYFKKYTSSSFIYRVLNLAGLHSNYFMVLVDSKGLVVGSIVLRKKLTLKKLSNDWFIYGVAIKNSYRGLGYGSALLSQTIDWCENKNVTKIFLWVDFENTQAMKLYNKYGFIECNSSVQNIFGLKKPNKKLLIKYLS